MHRLEAMVFWVMTLVGAGFLIPALVLPPWLEYQAQLERRRAAEMQVQALEFRLRAVEKQIDHLQRDPSYVLRLAEQEFGQPMGPATKTIPVDPSDDQPATPYAAGPQQDPGKQVGEDVLPELSAVLEEGIRRYPKASLFVDPRTRPAVMVIGGGMLLAAIVLLGRAGTARAVTRQATPATSGEQDTQD